MCQAVLTGGDGVLTFRSGELGARRSGRGTECVAGDRTPERIRAGAGVGELPVQKGVLIANGGGLSHDRPEMVDTTRGDVPASPDEEPRGCLFALSQPPLMIFLAVVGSLLLMAALHDLFML